MGGTLASDKNRGAEQPTIISFPMFLWSVKQNPLLIGAFILFSNSLAFDVPARVAHTETWIKSVPNPKPHVVQKRANGKVQAAYFSNWCVLCCLESLHSGLVQPIQGTFMALISVRDHFFPNS